MLGSRSAAPTACPPWPPPETLVGQSGGASPSAISLRPWSLLDFTAPIRSQVFFNVVGDLLCYSGANEVNTSLAILRAACRELRDQVDEECLTFNYDDTCGLSTSSGPAGDRKEILTLNAWIKRHPRLKYFECLIRSASKFRILLQELQLAPNVRCSFVFEFKVTALEVQQLLERFCVRRLSAMPEEREEAASGTGWMGLPDTSLQVLCLRSCSNEIARSFLSVSPRLRSLQFVDSRLQGNPGIQSSHLSSLSLTGITTLADDEFSKLIRGCNNLRSLYISKCNISHISVALPNLELLSVTHCRQLTNQCATEILAPLSNPKLRFVDLSECRSLTAPTVEHPGLEIAWLMHCPQLTGSTIENMFRSCTSLSAVNLVQSSIENAVLSSVTLRTLELTTSQKLTDSSVSQLLEHCPNLLFLDVGHCCQLVEPRLAHRVLETILLSFCVNLRESAVTGLFENCPSLRYVEIAVCMFEMTKFQRTCKPECTVVVNFDF